MLFIFNKKGALSVAKTVFPETQKTKATWQSIKNLPRRYYN
jgi:hypothetical protein